MSKSLSKSRFIEMFGDPNSNAKGYDKKPLRDLFALQMGKTPPRKEMKYWTDATNKWISISDMGTYDKYTTDTKEKIADCAISDTGIKVVPKNTVIMSFKLSIGKTAITSEDIYTNEAIMAFVKKNEKINNSFLSYALKMVDWTSTSSNAVKGVTLNKEIIGNKDFFIPPIELQNEFEKFSNQVDKSKFILQKMIEKLELLKKSRFIELFGDPFLIDEKEKVPFKNAIAETVKGPFGSDMKKSLFVPKSDTTYKVFSQVNAIQKDATAGDYYISAEYYEKMKRFTVNSGDYIVTCDGTLGKIYCLPENIEKGVISSSLLRIALNKDVISNVYFETIWNMYMLPMLVRRSRNACLVHLPSAKDIGNLPVPIPNIDKQRDYDKFSNQIDKSKLILQKQLDDLVGETK